MNGVTRDSDAMRNRFRISDRSQWVIRWGLNSGFAQKLWVSPVRAGLAIKVGEDAVTASAMLPQAAGATLPRRPISLLPNAGCDIATDDLGFEPRRPGS